MKRKPKTTTTIFGTEAVLGVEETHTQTWNNFMTKPKELKALQKVLAHVGSLEYHRVGGTEYTIPELKKLVKSLSGEESIVLENQWLRIADLCESISDLLKDASKRAKGK